MMPTGRWGSVTPSISIVAPIMAFSPSSCATLCICLAGNPQTSSAHSGVYWATWSLNTWNAGLTGAPLTVYVPSSAASTPDAS